MGGRGEARKKDRMDRVLLDIHSITAGGVVGVDRRRHRSRRGPGSAVCSSGPTASRRTLSDGGRAEGRGGVEGGGRSLDGILSASLYRRKRRRRRRRRPVLFPFLLFFSLPGRFVALERVNRFEPFAMKRNEIQWWSLVVTVPHRMASMLLSLAVLQNIVGFR